MKSPLEIAQQNRGWHPQGLERGWPCRRWLLPASPAALSWGSPPGPRLFLLLKCLLTDLGTGYFCAVLCFISPLSADTTGPEPVHPGCLDSNWGVIS